MNHLVHDGAQNQIAQSASTMGANDNAVAFFICYVVSDAFRNGTNASAGDVNNIGVFKNLPGRM